MSGIIVSNHTPLICSIYIVVAASTIMAHQHIGTEAPVLEGGGAGKVGGSGYYVHTTLS